MSNVRDDTRKCIAIAAQLAQLDSSSVRSATFLTQRPPRPRSRVSPPPRAQPEHALHVTSHQSGAMAMAFGPVTLLLGPYPIHIPNPSCDLGSGTHTLIPRRPTPWPRMASPRWHVCLTHLPTSPALIAGVIRTARCLPAGTSARPIYGGWQPPRQMAISAAVGNLDSGWQSRRQMAITRSRLRARDLVRAHSISETSFELTRSQRIWRRPSCAWRRRPGSWPRVEDAGNESQWRGQSGLARATTSNDACNQS